MSEPPQPSLTIEFALACLLRHLVRIAPNFSLHVHLQTLARKQLSHISARRTYSSHISSKFCNLADISFNKRKLALDESRMYHLILTDINDAGILIAMPSCSSLVMTDLLGYES